MCFAACARHDKNGQWVHWVVVKYYYESDYFVIGLVKILMGSSGTSVGGRWATSTWYC